MDKIVQFSVSIEHELLTKFDALIKAQGYTNISTPEKRSSIGSSL